MRVIREYKKAESLEEAWQLNQKKSNRVLGGMGWLIGWLLHYAKESTHENKE